MEEAIRWGILAPFTYHALEYAPDASDRQRVQQVDKNAAARKASGTPMSQEESWIELAKIHKTSRAKLPLFEDFIRRNRGLLTRCIIFVETWKPGSMALQEAPRRRAA